MKKLHLFVIKSYILPLLLIFVTAVFALLMQFIWKYVDELVGKGLELKIITELIFYASLYVVPMALPLAVLVASVMSFGNLGEHSELLALKSSGISLQKIMMPLIIVTLMVSVGAFAFSNYISPHTNLKMGTLLHDIRHQRPELNLKAGSFNNDISGYTIKIGRKNHETKMMYDFAIYDHSQYYGNNSVTTADSAYMQMTEDDKFMILTLYGGAAYEEVRNRRKIKQKPHNRFLFSKQTITISLADFEFKRTDEQLFRHGHMTKNLNKLNEAIDSVNKYIHKRQDRYYYNLMTTNLLKGEIKESRVEDSLKKVNAYDTITKVVKIDMDSTFKEIADNQKSRIVNMAKGMCTAAHSYIKSHDRDLYNYKVSLNKYKTEWHNKFSLALSCLIFFFVGAPLGAIIRKGGLAMPLVISSLLFVGYYIISLIGKKIGIEGIIPVAMGMWSAPFVISSLAAFLMYKAVNDSVMLQVDTYKDILKNIFNKRLK